VWLSEKVLSLASRPPAGPDHPGGVEQWDESSALDLLRREFAGFDDLVRGRRVLDFGCGNGLQSLALARAGSRHVLGVDTNETCLASARKLVREANAREVEFSRRVPRERLGTFDIIVSQNSFEHFPDPVAILAEMTAALAPAGRILVTFGPPWMAPYGSHMYFFTKMPWVNLVFSERTVMRVRSRFRSDGAERYEDVEGGLNRMTVSRFERLIAESGLRLETCRYRAVKGLDFLTPVPVVRELFVNVVTCVLARGEHEAPRVSGH
jgi:SAM-dependent methyltransferase